PSRCDFRRRVSVSLPVPARQICRRRVNVEGHRTLTPEIFKTVRRSSADQKNIALFQAHGFGSDSPGELPREHQQNLIALLVRFGFWAGLITGRKSHHCRLRPFARLKLFKDAVRTKGSRKRFALVLIRPTKTSAARTQSSPT